VSLLFSFGFSPAAPDPGAPAQTAAAFFPLRDSNLTVAVALLSVPQAASAIQNDGPARTALSPGAGGADGTSPLGVSAAVGGLAGVLNSGAGEEDGYARHGKTSAEPDRPRLGDILIGVDEALQQLNQDTRKNLFDGPPGPTSLKGRQEDGEHTPGAEPLNAAPAGELALPSSDDRLARPDQREGCSEPVAATAPRLDTSPERRRDGPVTGAPGLCPGVPPDWFSLLAGTLLGAALFPILPNRSRPTPRLGRSLRNSPGTPGQ
jgi:hypothetical protein